LESAGLSAGHERVFGLKGYSPQAVSSYGVVAESSWLAVPALGESYLSDTLVIHLVRDPYAVVSSLLCGNFFRRESGNAYEEFAYRHEPMLKSLDTALAKIVAFYAKWNLRVAPYANVRHKVEEPPEQLLEQLSIPYDTKKLFRDSTYNSWGGHDEVSRDDILALPQELYEPFLDLVVSYGYDADEH
tara:strand:- start:1737 stop:2297 length:561 start_codon:yes stop_codon:yes gene_type:complete